MKRFNWYTLLCFVATSALISQSAYASFVNRFKFDDGRTNWQYIANFSSGVLIILLLLVAIFLCITLVRAHRANKELRAIKAELEQRVKERTATLDESNRLLQRTNSLLEGEIHQHKQTSILLASSEAYIKSILDSMPVTLIGLDKDFQITQWNNFATQTTGLALKNVLNQNLWEAYPSITLSQAQAQKVLDTGEAVTIKHCQRGQYYFDITVYALQGENETGLVVLVDDVTQQSKAENLLIQKDKFSSMGELAAGMAHDINMPLTTIREEVVGLIDLCQQNSKNTQSVLSVLTSTKNHCEQASAIVKHLLDFSNTDSEEKESTEILRVIDHSLDVASNMFANTNGIVFKDIDIIKHYSQDVPRIPGHISELQLVFLTIFRHACHAFSEKKLQDFKPKLTIEVNTFYDSLWVKVQHNGKGLTSEEQMTIFEPFYQDKDTIENGCDLESRLSFSYFIVADHHGGEMSVTSDVDVGSTFHIQLLLR